MLRLPCLRVLAWPGTLRQRPDARGTGKRANSRDADDVRARSSADELATLVWLPLTVTK